MSATVDQRVVEMRFDNKQFESGIQTSLSALDRLKQGLKLDEAANSLNKLNDTAKNFSLAGIANGVDNISSKFTALNAVAFTALQNITNSAFNAGKNIIKSLTIDPIKAGFQEYETQINSVQTILANTESKGTTLNNVTNALDELNTYADKTIYNFTEMTRNIGTFTAAGVDLDVSVQAIKGIANLAAVSGSNAQQASTAMYQLSQALSSGTVKLMDWNSVVNAGMGGQVFQDSLKETARVHGIAIDDMIKNEGSFRETLQNGWLTSDILTETLSKFTGDLNEKQLKTMGYSDDQIKSILKLGQTANDAATKVKTFTQLFDTLKEAAQSGWTKSWEIIVGDFGEAKESLTEMSNTFGGIINARSDKRNQVLLGGLSTGWTQLLKQGISDSAGYQDAIKEVAKSHGVDLDSMINDDVSFQDVMKKTFSEGTLDSSTLVTALQKLTDKTAGLSDEQLDELGYTRKQIDSLEELNKKVQNGTISMDEFAKKMSMSSGRENLIEALRNSLNGLLEIIKPISEAFEEIFPPMTAEQLYKITEYIKELTSNFHLSDETARNLKNTFKGLFAVLDIGGQAISAIFNAIKPLFGYLGEFGNGLLGVTGPLGEYLVSLDETIRKTDSFNEAFKKVGEFFKPVVDKVKGAVDNIKEAFASFKDVDLSPIDNLTGRVQARFEPFTKIGDMVKKSFSKISEVLEKMSPVFAKLREAASKVSEGIQEAISKAFDDFEFDSMFDLINGGLFSLILLGIKKFINSLTGVVDEGKGMFKGINGITSSIKGIFDGVRESLKSFQAQLKADVLYKIAGAIALLTASVFVLSLIDSKKLTASLVAMSAMFVDLFGSMAIFEKIVGSKSFKSMGKVTTSLIGLSIAILLLSFAMKNLSELDWNGIAKGLVGVVGLSAILVGSAKVLSKNSGKMISGSIGLVIFAGAISILVNAVKELGALDIGSLAKGLIGVGVLLTELAIFMKLTDVNKMGIGKGLGLLILAEAVNILADATSKFASLDVANLSKGLGAIALVLTELAIFVNTTGNASKVISTAIGLTILGAALLIISNAVSNMGDMSWEQIAKGLLTMAGALTLITVAMNFMPKDMILTGSGLVVVASALLILSKALSSMGGMSWEQIGKGLVVLAGSLTIIALAMIFMKTALPGAAALLIVSAALTILTKALLSLGSMSLAEIGKGLLALAGTFTVIGVAALVLSPIIPVILALAGAVALLGVGLLAIGAGTLAFSAGLSALAVSGVAGAAALVVIVTSIIGLIPLILEKLGEGIIAFCKIITDGAPAIAEAMYTVVAATVSTLVNTIPMVVDGVLLLITTILEKIAEYTPRIIEAGMNILVEFLRGIANNIQAVVEAGIEIATNFINGVAEKLPELIDSGFNLVISFIEGIAEAIDKNTDRMIDAGEKLFDSLVNAGKKVLEASIVKFADIGSAIMNSGFIKGIEVKISDAVGMVKKIPEQCLEALSATIDGFYKAGSNVIDGFISGLKDKITEAATWASNLATDVLDSAKKVLGINSPSKAFAEIGMYTVKGFSNGLNKFSYLAKDSVSNLGKSSVSYMSKAVSKVSDIFSSDMSNSPTIRPVLDLTNVESGASKINSIFNQNRGISVSASLNKASDISSNINSNNKISPENSNLSPKTTNVSLTQNNYSPKALSTADIYRQTKQSISLVSIGGF